MPKHDPPRERDPSIPFEAMTPELSEAMQRAELARTHALDRCISEAEQLDQPGVFELGSDIAAAGRRKHRDVTPFPEGDARRDALRGRPRPRGERRPDRGFEVRASPTRRAAGMTVLAERNQRPRYAPSFSKKGTWNEVRSKEIRRGGSSCR